MSTRLLLGVAGGVVGAAFGFPGLGFTIGSAVGAAFEPNKTQKLPDVEGPRLGDLEVQSSAYGEYIPLQFGRNRLAGNIIWAPPIKEHLHREEVSSGGGGKGGGGGGGSTQTQTTYSYTGSFATAICRGPVSGFGRIWMNGKLFYDASPSAAPSGVYASNARAQAIRFYLGDETQVSDPALEANKGIGNVPGYRGLAYIVFEDLQLDDFGNRIPNVTVEVLKSGSVQNGKKFPVINEGYFYGGSSSSDPAHVMTVNEQGVSRILNINTGQIRLINTDGYFMGNDTRDGTIDAYGDNKPSSCGRLNGYLLNFEGSGFYPFGGTHPLHGDGPPPEIWAYPDGFNFATSYQSIKVVNLLDIGLNPNHFLYGLLVSEDQRRAMIVTGSGNNPFGATTYPEDWYLIYISGEGVVVEASGTAAGFKDGYVNGLGVGNRAGIGSNGFYAGTLENDYKHVWVAYGAGNKPIDCYRVETGGVTNVFSSNTDLNGFSRPTLLADSGVMWVTNRFNIEVFTRHPIPASNEPPLAQVVSELCELSNLTASDINVSLLTGNIKGYTVSSQSTIRTALQQLMSAYFFDAVESANQIKFMPRGNTPLLTIDKDNLAVHGEGEDSLPDIVTINRQQELELPKRVNISYVNVNADYQIGLQYAAKINTDSVSETSVELPIVLTDDEAAKIADAWLFGTWQGRETHSANVGLEYLYLEPGDVITLDKGGAQFITRLTSVEFGGPGVLQLTSVAEDAAVYASNVIGGATDIETQNVGPTGPTALRLMDIPILRGVDNEAGYYVTASGYYDTWPGCAVLQSSDGAAFNQIKVFALASIVGVSTNTLGDGLTSVIDRGNAVNVQVFQGQLSSITDDQLLSGGNLALLGKELFQFRDAVLEANGTYTLSHLVRGRKGTEQHTATHSAIEEFTFITEETIQRVIQDIDAIGVPRVYKAVTLGATPESTRPKNFTNTAQGLKPYSPVHLKGRRDGANNLTITWIRRNRLGGEWRDSVGVPVSEDTENYEVDILNGANVVRTIAIISQTASYTAAEQSSDGLTPGDPVDVEVYQLSATVGRGFKATATL